MEVNARVHTEIHAVPEQRLATELGVLGELPSLRLEVGPKPITRRVDKLSCIRFGSARYSVPNRLIGTTVTVLVDERDRLLRVIEPVTGEIHAEHALVAPGEVSIIDAHYDRPRPDTPRRGARPRTPVEREFLALGPVAEQFLVGAATAGVTKLGTEIAEILTLGAAHGHEALLTALERAVTFGRRRAADVRSILATNGHAPRPTAAGQALVLTLPSVPTRSLDTSPPSTPAWTGVRCRDRHQPTTAAGGPERGLEAFEDGGDAPAGTRALGHCEDAAVDPEEFLRTLVEAEITARDASNVRTRMRQAAFPVTKTLAEFDVAASSIPPATFDYLSSLEWIRASENVCMIGPAGTGKSHTLIALGIAAFEAGHRVRYFTAADLVETLYRGLADNSVGKVIDRDCCTDR